ncbi:hypothetical protein R6Q59_030124 [Mikania micrantha]
MSVHARFNVSKEGSMLTGCNQSVWLPMVIPDKSKYLNDDSDETHLKSSTIGTRRARIHSSLTITVLLRSRTCNLERFPR